MIEHPFLEGMMTAFVLVIAMYSLIYLFSERPPKP